MNRILAIFLTLALPALAAAEPARGLSKNPATTPPSVPQKSAETPDPDPVPTTPTREGTSVRWFGHAFIYLTSQGGVRIAINPFSEGTVGYEIPDRLPAEIVLISSEAADHSGGQHIFGIPQIFRSLAGVGANRANGIPFRGINTWRDNEGGKRLGRNTVYVMEVDGQRFCHLGTLGHPLSSRDAAAIGRVDVLFLPVGTLNLSVSEILRNAELLGAKWIVPITYKTARNSKIELRPLSSVHFGSLPVQQANSSEFIFHAKSLPEKPTVLLLREP